MKRSLRLLWLLGLLLLANLWTVSAQTPESAPGGRSLSLGFHLGRGDARHMAAARAAGSSFVVVVFNWANIEPEPNYLYWETPDAALRAAEFYGLQVVARLDQPPAWAIQKNAPVPWNLEAYANFARRVAERYGNRLAGVTIWNEPNLNLEWNNRPPDPVAYTEMLKQAYPAVKGVAPELPVLLAGLASTEGEGDWAINDLDYLEGLYGAGAKDYFDILTAHPYGFGRPPDDPPEKFRPNFRRLELYHGIMAASGDENKPIWVTEMGWLTRTENPKHRWQVVTPQLQADYTLEAIAYAKARYPWLERLGLWQLDASGDKYGYDLWAGPEQSSLAYQALVESCSTWSQACQLDLVAATPHPSIHSATQDADGTIEILASDVIIRLGDRGMLHPHWVHLHEGGENFSPAWQGEFFLTADQVHQPYELLLETMQIDQSTNWLSLNGVKIGRLQARPRPDPTSTWVTQRLPVPPESLQAGLNTFSITAGPRNPARQYVAGRWENMQFRHIRLTPFPVLPPASLGDWQARPSPGGWSETNRLRPGLGQSFWLTGIAPGQLWHGPPLQNEAGNRPDLVFNDLLPLPQGELAATDRGLFWREAGRPDWEPVETAPAAYAYQVTLANRHFYAGFEGQGLWQASVPKGSWQRVPLTATTILDLFVQPYFLPDRLAPVERLYLTTPDQVWVNDGLTSRWSPFPLPGLTPEALEEAGESPGDKFEPHLYPTAEGRLVARQQDRLWQQNKDECRMREEARASVNDESGGLISDSSFCVPYYSSQEAGAIRESWSLLGPESLYGKFFTVLDCCQAGTLVGTHQAGIWQLNPNGEWQRFDEDRFFEESDVTGLLRLGPQLYAAGDLGLFQQAPGQPWQKVEGLPSTVTDLVVDPAEPARWFAATPAGLYRSQDAGESWQPVTPPWTIWDLAFGPAGRLFVGRRDGLAWTDEPGSASIPWQKAEGMGQVYFLRLNPHPVDPQIIWTGTWGNNIGVSQDGGQTIEPLHHGLETLSGLDLIWHATPGQVTLATFEGLYRTDDGGQSWFKLPGPLTHQTIYSLLQTDEGAIWAGAADGLWVSRDYGVTWEQPKDLPPATVIRLDHLPLPNPPLETPPPFVALPNEALVYNPKSWLWAGTEGAGLWLSQDGGQSWRFAGLPEQTVYQLFFNPVQPRQLVAATAQGIFALTLSETTLATLAALQP